MNALREEKGRARERSLQIVLLILLCGALALCWIVGSRHDERRNPPEPEVPISGEDFSISLPYLTVTRADHETESTEAQTVNLSEQKDELLISGGEWILTGKMTGRIRIAAEDQNVHLFLAGATLNSREGPAIQVESAGKVIITLTEGSENQISDSGDYRKSQDAEACIYSAADLTINGTGALIVNGLFKDAIRSRNVVKIMDGKITIRSKRTGIHGTDGIHVAGGELDISSEKVGLRTTKAGTEGRGDLVVAGGILRIIAGRNAFVAERGNLYIYNCSIFDKSVVNTWNVGGKVKVQDGCIQ